MSSEPPFWTPTIKANQLRMLRRGFGGAFVLVEGTTDVALFKRFTDATAAHMSHVGNKELVSATVEIMNREAFSGVVGIVDSDRDRILGIAQTSNVFAMDHCDVECTLLLSDAYLKVMDEYASPAKVTRFQNAYGDVREHLFAQCAHLGGLRLVSRIENLNLTFEDTQYEHFTDVNMVVNIEAMIDYVLQKSGQAQSRDKVRRRLSELDAMHYDATELCNGHDTVAILTIGLKRALGSNRGLRAEDMERALRLSFEYEHLRRTALHREIAEWEESNQPFSIWR